jgi:hypothetical protein
MASPDYNGWWRTKGLMFIALAAWYMSDVVPAGWKPAFKALGFAAFSADCALGWIKAALWRRTAVILIAVVSVVAEFAPRMPALIALLALFAFWGVSFWKYSEPGTIVLSIPRS